MKLIITSILFLSSYFCIGQSLSDTTIIIDNDTLVLFRGNPSEEISYHGGFAQFINQSLSHPILDYIRKKKIRGRMFVSFIVEKSGEVNHVNIESGVDPYVDEEILKIIKGTIWRPAKDSNGEAVNRQIKIPIIF